VLNSKKGLPLAVIPPEKPFIIARKEMDDKLLSLVDYGISQNVPQCVGLYPPAYSTVSDKGKAAMMEAFDFKFDTLIAPNFNLAFLLNKLWVDGEFLEYFLLLAKFKLLEKEFIFSNTGFYVVSHKIAPLFFTLKAVFGVLNLPFLKMYWHPPLVENLSKSRNLSIILSSFLTLLDNFTFVKKFVTTPTTFYGTCFYIMASGFYDLTVVLKFNSQEIVGEQLLQELEFLTRLPDIDSRLEVNTKLYSLQALVNYYNDVWSLDGSLGIRIPDKDAVLNELYYYHVKGTINGLPSHDKFRL
jgi:hypothetical protein